MQSKFIEKTEGSTTSTENEMRALILFFRKNEVVGVELEICVLYKEEFDPGSG